LPLVASCCWGGATRETLAHQGVKVLLPLVASFYIDLKVRERKKKGSKNNYQKFL
jgi:hypothetical protein